MSDDGIQKSAILLMSLGEDEAAEVLKCLAPREVQKIANAMAGIKGLTRAQIKGVLDDFCAQAGEKGAPGAGAGAEDYVRSVLRKALGDDKSAPLIASILKAGDTSGIDGLKWMDSAVVAALIKGEHPQIIATILLHLDRDQCAEVLKRFPDRLRSDVLFRIATLDGVQPAALRELNEVLAKMLAGGNGAGGGASGGVRTAAEILNLMGGTQETALIDSFRELDAGLTEKILDQMFVWEDLLGLEDRAVQLLLREVQSESLILALKGSSEALRERVYANMSQRAAEMLKEDLEAKGMVRVSEVEAQQKEILQIVRRLAGDGQIALAGKGQEAYV